jgi:hypothetical protein
MEQKCTELGLECAFPKPFCTLEPEKDKPTITRFIKETAVGRPLLEISTTTIGRDQVIEYAAVKRNAPCGSTWYVARKLAGVSTKKENTTQSPKRTTAFHARQRWSQTLRRRSRFYTSAVSRFEKKWKKRWTRLEIKDNTILKNAHPPEKNKNRQNKVFVSSVGFVGFRKIAQRLDARNQIGKLSYCFVHSFLSSRMVC